MSNKKAFVLGILSVFGFNIAFEMISEAIYLRAKRKLNNAGIIVGIGYAGKKQQDRLKDSDIKYM